MTVYFNGGEPVTATEIVERRAEALERIRRGFDAAAAIYLRPAWEAVRMMDPTYYPFPEPDIAPRPGAPNAKECNAEQDPKEMCMAGEHGRCGGAGCGCWCHRERLDKQKDG